MATSRKGYLVDIDRETGEFISGWDRIRQSIRTILTTRTFTRVMRLSWGSDFQDMIDKPINQETIMDGIVAAIRSVNAYEPEFAVTAVEITGPGYTGEITIKAIGVDLVQNQGRTVETGLTRPIAA